MKVAIDLTKTNFDNPVGVDRYALAMTKALKEGHPELDWVVLTKKDIRPGFFSTQLGVALATWKDRKIDVLWSPVPTMPILRRPGLKTVVTIHDLEGSKWSTKWSLRLADKVVAVSEATARKIGKMGIKGKIGVIQEGVDTTTFYPRSQDEVSTVKTRLGITGDYFLFVGTVGLRKNVENLIRGFAEFVTAVIPTKVGIQHSDGSRVKHGMTSILVIAGSVADDCRHIFDLPKQLGIADHVKFLGRVADANLPALYSGAVATCLVSHDEGFGLPILESLACGRPVVVSNRGIMSELAGSCGVTIAPTSIESISDGLRQVSQIDSNKCHTQVEKYSWGSAADRLVGVIEGLVSKGNKGNMGNMLLGVGVDKVNMVEALRQIAQFVSEPRFHLVTTVNPEFILTAQKDLEFKEILNHADLSLPDGLGVVLAVRVLGLLGIERTFGATNLFTNCGRGRPMCRPVNSGRLSRASLDESRRADTPVRPYYAGDVTRVAGSDLVPALIKLAAEKAWSVGFLGGEDWHGQNVCDLVKQHFLSKYPSLRVAYCSREATPEVFLTPLDILFVAFGHPKQEKWLWSNKDRLQVKVGIGVGGTFDFIVGKQKRAPVIFQKLGLEGLWRLFLEPKRWKRVFRAYVVFPIKFVVSLLLG